MSKHTPGPWYVNYDFQSLRIESHQDGYVADIRGGFEDADANARLIAAAPDMREELTKALDWLASYPGGGASNRYDAIRALLARIDGETP